MSIRVRGIEIPVNIKAEIEEYEWNHPIWKENRLLACSPFRDEKHPSFAVNLENGTFVDSGGDGEWRKGNFVKLLSFINSESYEETEERLISLYSPQLAELDNLALPDIDDWMAPPSNKRVFTKEEMERFAFKHPYLESRGIPFNVQRAFDVGYEPQTKSVVIPWHNMKGEVVSWKHRKVDSKVFWYASGGQPIRNHLYGIHWIVKREAKTAWIVEAEIDALTLWSKGIPAVAIGSSFLSNEKRDLILKSGIENLVVATDNDKDGRKAKASIIEKLAGFVNISEIDWSQFEAKDINEIRDNLHCVSVVDVSIVDIDGY